MAGFPDSRSQTEGNTIGYAMLHTLGELPGVGDVPATPFPTMADQAIDLWVRDDMNVVSDVGAVLATGLPELAGASGGGTWKTTRPSETSRSAAEMDEAGGDPTPAHSPAADPVELVTSAERFSSVTTFA